MKHVNESPHGDTPENALTLTGLAPTATATLTAQLPSPPLPPLLPYPAHCVVGRFVSRHKRFSVAVRLHDEEVWVHSNNSGSMLGLKRPGMPVMLSPAANPARKLAWTQECVWMDWGRPAAPPRSLPDGMPTCITSCITDGTADCPVDPKAFDTAQEHSSSGFWVGVNTSTPNRLLAAAFTAGQLPFATGYTHLQREAKRGDSRLDACLTGPDLPPLWVECKNVTMVEDAVACFPDAATERGQKHLRALMDIVRHGERAATFYLVQRADGTCFGPADVVDPLYAELFWQALDVGVEIYPYRARISSAGIDLGELLPLTKQR